MNKLTKTLTLLVALTLSITANAGETVDYLQDRNGIKYEINAEQPFTGKYVSKHEKWYRWWHENGEKKREVNYKDGKLHGLTTRWHENGQKMYEENFVDGYEHGLATYWYENGSKWIEKNWDNGKRQGKRTEWHRNGQKRDGGLRKWLTSWL